MAKKASREKKWHRACIINLVSIEVFSAGFYHVAFSELVCLSQGAGVRTHHPGDHSERRRKPLGTQGGEEERFSNKSTLSAAHA